MPKKKQEPPTKPPETPEEPTTEPEPEVTQVTEVIPEEATPPEPDAPTEEQPDEAPKAATPPGLVNISEMPTKNIKRSPINFTENDNTVRDWYNSLSAGQKFTLEEAATELDLSVEEVENSIKRLQKTCLPEQLGHITQ